jgi:hypothetical protein
MRPDTDDIKTFQQKAQSAGIDLFYLLKLLGPLEPVLLQALLKKAKSVAIPI